MLTVGIDIGSMSTKAVIFNGQSYYKAIAPPAGAHAKLQNRSSTICFNRQDIPLSRLIL